MTSSAHEPLSPVGNNTINRYFITTLGIIVTAIQNTHLSRQAFNILVLWLLLIANNLSHYCVHIGIKRDNQYWRAVTVVC